MRCAIQIDVLPFYLTFYEDVFVYMFVTLNVTKCVPQKYQICRYQMCWFKL